MSFTIKLRKQRNQYKKKEEADPSYMTPDQLPLYYSIYKF